MDSDLNSGYIRGHRFFQSCQVNSHLSFNTEQSTKLVTDEDDNLVLYVVICRIDVCYPLINISHIINKI